MIAEAFMGCALALPSFGWVKSLPAYIAQAIIAPIASVHYSEDDYLFIEWIFSLIKRYQAPNTSVLIFDNTLRQTEMHIKDPDKQFGLILFDTFFTMATFEKAFESLADGGTLVFHANRRVYIAVRKEALSRHLKNAA